MQNKQNAQPINQRLKLRQQTRVLPLIDTALQYRLDPSLTIQGWRTTQTEEKKFFDKLKTKQACRFRTKRIGSCSMNRKDIQSLLIAKHSPHMHAMANHSVNKTEDKFRDMPRDVLKPKTYIFGVSDISQLKQNDVKQIVLPRHALNLSKVIREIPDDRRDIPFTSFVRSLHQEHKRSRRPRGRWMKQIINETSDFQ